MGDGPTLEFERRAREMHVTCLEEWGAARCRVGRAPMSSSLLRHVLGKGWPVAPTESPESTAEHTSGAPQVTRRRTWCRKQAPGRPSWARASRSCRPRSRRPGSSTAPRRGPLSRATWGEFPCRTCRGGDGGRAGRVGVPSSTPHSAPGWPPASGPNATLPGRRRAGTWFGWASGAGAVRPSPTLASFWKPSRYDDGCVCVCVGSRPSMRGRRRRGGPGLARWGGRQAPRPAAAGLPGGVSPSSAPGRGRLGVPIAARSTRRARSRRARPGPTWRRWSWWPWT